ncbi:MAG: hypothetical protein RLZZ532_4264, partial [Cyanobacteriota bacterium]
VYSKGDGRNPVSFASASGPYLLDEYQFCDKVKNCKENESLIISRLTKNQYCSQL